MITTDDFRYFFIINSSDGTTTEPGIPLVPKK